MTTLSHDSTLAMRDRHLGLDLVRGLCAVLVCAGHLRAVVFVDHANLVSPTLWQRVFYLLTGLGHESVMVFFVLSGLFVGGAVLEQRSSFDVRRYAIARLSRLWIVLVPALVLTLAVDLYTASSAPDVMAGRFNAAWNSGPPRDGSYSASAGTFAANVLFLQTIAAPVFGTNDPLWSLANEFWYYVMFPLFAIAAGVVRPTGGASLAARIVAGAIGLTALLSLPWVIQSEFSIWLLGLAVFAARGRLSPIGARICVGIGTALFVTALAYSKLVLWQSIFSVPREAVVGVAFCVLCIGLVQLRSSRSASTWPSRLARVSSEISFSLYLVHFPLVACIGGAWYGSGKIAPTALGLLQFGGWLAGIVLFGAVFWWLFERNTDAVRRWLTDNVMTRRAQRLAP